MAYKRILTIQDISCVGQCSMTVAMPILSACGHECCILPTAVLSTHTGGFGKPAVHHLSDSMDEILRHWHAQGITFDAVLVGYLGSVKAVKTAGEIIRSMLSPGGISIVDPAMADHGKCYSGLDDAYVRAMEELCLQADIMMPNITEAAMMTGMDYHSSLDEDYVRQLLERLGGKDIILTGVGFGEGQTGAAIRKNGAVSFVHHPREGKSCHGTGDMFAACFTGCFMQGMDTDAAVGTAGEFVRRSIRETMAEPVHWYGVKFETQLPWLIDQFRK